MLNRVLGLIGVLVVATGVAVAQQPVAQQPAPQPAVGGVRSKVTVTVPQDDAKLTVEQKATSTPGKVRVFDTPADLKDGVQYLYDLQVTWAPNKFTTITRTRTVKFKGGDEVTVDLTKPDAADKVVTTLASPSADVVAELVKAAKIVKDDVAFEPGGADANTLIAAVKAGAKRGVLVQPAEDKGKVAKEQIKTAELEGKVEVQPAEPVAGKDYAEATVVFLYVGDELNAALLPVLLRDLKPGARVVSYRFKLGDWEPAATAKGVNAGGDNYEIYTWTVTDEAKKKYGGK